MEDHSGAARAVPAKARAVLIGAGIVGNSLAYHLARLGWTDLVLLDKGPLPNPGGSTGHASNFIFPVDHSREMTALTADSVRQYTELDVITVCGGIEVARTEERMEELRRRMSSAASWGIDGVSLVTPAEVKELVPVHRRARDRRRLLLPRRLGRRLAARGHADARARAGARRADRVGEHRGARASTSRAGGCGACARPAATSRPSTSSSAAASGARASRAWPGASIPLTPAVHQMIDIGPVPRFAGAKASIEYPIVRDMDTNMYERQDGGGLEVGSYAHRPILHDPDEIPSIEESALSPTELPFTEDDFVAADGARARADAGDRRRRVGRHQVRDQRPALAHARRPADPGRDARGARACGRPRPCGSRRVPGVGRAVAEWMVLGEPEIDLQASDIARFYEHQKSVAHVTARAAEGFNKTYGIVHPARAVGVQPRRPALPVPRARARAGRGVLRGRRVGAAALVRVQRRAGGGVRRRRPRGGVGVALVVADHQRRAPGDARPRGDVRPDRVLRLRHRRPGRARVRAAGLDAPDGRGARQGRLHAGAHPARRVPVRPDRDARSATSTSAS